MPLIFRRKNAQEPPMLFVGLGNPGLQYERTRHNVGFWAVETLAQRWGIRLDKNRDRAKVGEGRVEGQRVVLALPQTYMNDSGRSVAPLSQWYKTPPGHIAVLLDDVDLPAGRLRIRPGGSSGTHNGMRSIVRECGFEDFPRIRIGIGPKPEARDLAGYVLAKLSAEEEKLLRQATDDAAAAAEVLLLQGVDAAMAKYNGVIQR